MLLVTTVLRQIPLEYSVPFLQQTLPPQKGKGKGTDKHARIRMRTMAVAKDAVASMCFERRAHVYMIHAQTRFGYFVNPYLRSDQY